jgi:alanyl aminopeptidase
MLLAFSLSLAAPSLRLPEGARPMRESIELAVDPRADDFRGSATIRVRIDRPSRELRLNAKNLASFEADVYQDEARLPATVRVVDEETIELRWSRGLSGEVDVVIHYSGKESPLESQVLFRRTAGASGYYRVDYPEALLPPLLSGGSAAVSPAERIGVVEGAAAMVDAGRLPAGLLLRQLPALAADPEPEMVRSAVRIAASLHVTRIPSAERERWTAFVRGTFGPIASDWGFAARPDEPTPVALGRPSLISLAGAAGDDPALAAEATRLAESWLTDRSGVDPSMVDVVLSLAARHGDRALLDRIRAQAASEADRERREQLLAALGAFEDPTLTAAALELALDPVIDIREAFGLFFTTFGGVGTRDTAWDWMDRLFGGRARRWLGGGRTLAQVHEGVQLCIATREVQAPELAAFLSAWSPAR